MKCPMCDGTGTSNTCVNGTFKPCSFCDGTGEFDPNEVDRFNAVDFIKVMEMVKKPLTNEEWLRQASTEEKALFLARVYGHSRKINLPELLFRNVGTREVTDVAEYIGKWLKEKHE